MIKKREKRKKRGQKKKEENKGKRGKKGKEKKKKRSRLHRAPLMINDTFMSYGPVNVQGPFIGLYMDIHTLTEEGLKGSKSLFLGIPAIRGTI